MRLVEARAARKLVNNLNQKGARNQASIGFVFASQHGLLFALSWAQVRAMPICTPPQHRHRDHPDLHQCGARPKNDRNGLEPLGSAA